MGPKNGRSRVVVWGQLLIVDNFFLIKLILGLADPAEIKKIIDKKKIKGVGLYEWKHVCD